MFFLDILSPNSSFELKVEGHFESCGFEIDSRDQYLDTGSTI